MKCFSYDILEGDYMVFSFLTFLLTGVVIYLGIYIVTPKLIKKGIPKVYAFWLSLWLPIFLLTPIALIHYRFIEQGGFTWDSIQDRFLLNPVEGINYLWIVLAIIGTIVLEELLQPISRYFAKKQLLAPPDYLPAPFNPLKKFTFPPETFFDVKLQGNYKLLMVFIPLHLLAMVSEEIMWRGYILPMQIEIFGSLAWVVNGLMWAYLVHLCLKWHFVAMLPGMLVVPFIAQMMNSTIAAFYVHAIPNMLLWIILWIGIRGKNVSKTMQEE